MDFEIYFKDLKKKAQKRFLAYQEMASEEEGNFDVFPIAIIYNSKEDDTDNNN